MPHDWHADQWIYLGTAKVSLSTPYSLPRRHRGGGEAYLYSFFNLGTEDGGGWSTSRPAALPKDKRPGTHMRLGGRQGLSGPENLASTVLRSTDRPACSDSLHRLSYPGTAAHLLTVSGRPRNNMQLYRVRSWGTSEHHTKANCSHMRIKQRRKRQVWSRTHTHTHTHTLPRYIQRAVPQLVTEPCYILIHLTTLTQYTQRIGHSKTIPSSLTFQRHCEEQSISISSQ